FHELIGRLSSLDASLAGQASVFSEINLAVAKSVLGKQREKASARVAAMKTARELAARAAALTLHDLPALRALLDGVRPERALDRPAKILVVCSGNTDRRPMAELIFKKALAAQGIRELDASSRGTLAVEGSPVSPQTELVLREVGIDAAGHRAK